MIFNAAKLDDEKPSAASSRASGVGRSSCRQVSRPRSPRRACPLIDTAARYVAFISSGLPMKTLRKEVAQTPLRID